MMHRFLARMSALPAAAALMLLAQMPAAGQQAATRATQKKAAPASSRFVVPHTAWGDPDLQGVYTFATLTPSQRPAAKVSGWRTYTHPAGPDHPTRCAARQSEWMRAQLFSGSLLLRPAGRQPAFAPTASVRRRPAARSFVQEIDASSEVSSDGLRALFITRFVSLGRLVD